jgi:uncharacterized repeat protein (TIGR03803 family)
VDPTGKETLLHAFGSTGDGVYPRDLLRDAQGSLYGTTQYGGNSACKGGCGTVFKVDTTGKETVLHPFTGFPDGFNPVNSGGLVQDTQGNLYGTTYRGGGYSVGLGTVFKVDTTGKETVLYSFGSHAWDGTNPTGGVVLDANGNLYGTTDSGGEHNQNGTVFELDTTGKETVLHSFSGGRTDGAQPQGGLAFDAHGNLYGTTYSGGGDGGTVFKLLFSSKAATTTTLTSSPDPSIYGQAVTFTATVTSSKGSPPDGESVTFVKNPSVLGTATLSGGSASLTTSTMKAGKTGVRAVYGGDANFATSTSYVFDQLVYKATTTTTVVSSQNPSSLGQSVTFTANITPQFGGKITGTVTFYDGTTTLNTVAISGGTAKFSTSTLTSGKHSITATYNGSTNFDSSSASLTQTVN